MLKLIFHYLKMNKGKWFVLCCFVLLQAGLQVFGLIAEMKKIVDYGVGSGDMQYIYNAAIRMTIYTLLIFLCTIVTSYLSAKITASIVCAIREDCYHKITQMSTSEYNQFGSSLLLTRTMTDAVSIQTLVLNLMRTSMLAPFVVVCMLIMIFRIDFYLFAVLFITFVITVTIMIFLGNRSQPYFGKLQQAQEKINLQFRENITGVRTIRAFSRQAMQEERVGKVNEDAYEKAVEANRHINFLSPIALIILNWSVVAVYLIGSQELKMGMASSSDLMLVFQYIAYFIASLAVIPVMINLVPKAAVSAARINEILDLEVNAESEDKLRAGIDKGEIEFRNVRFGYNDVMDVISNMNLRIPAGKVTAFIGGTGAGKTTVLNLINRIYEATSGEVFIDGHKVREYDKKYVQSCISYATQKTMVFQDTVYNNITAYRSDISEERLRQACDASCFQEVIQRLDNGMDTMMALNGMNFSGGQRQRLSLARAVAKDAAIYMFDDTFSALDAKTEQNARREIMKLLKDKTILMVAQRVSTIQDADQIVVLDKGCIVGVGTHKDLLESCAEYQEIYRIQNYINKGGVSEGGTAQ